MTTLSRPMTRRIALLTTMLVLALAVPAGAQSGPFGPLPQAAPTATATPESAAVDDGKTGRNVLFIIGVWWGLVALIAVRLVTCAIRFAGSRWALTGAPA